MTTLSLTRSEPTEAGSAEPRRFASMLVVASERGTQEGEFVVEPTVRDHSEIFLRSEFALQRPNATVLGGEEHHFRALLLLFGDPSLELGAAGDERRHAIAGVEVLALPVHLV